MKFLLRMIGLTLLLTSCNNSSTQEASSNKKQNDMGIVFSDSEGNSISMKELSEATGSYNYSVFGAEEVSDAAQAKHNEARALGQNGEYDKAIDVLKEAHKIAPSWPYPLYDLAYTYLLKDDYQNAFKYYKATDSLAPKGFFTSKVAVHTLEREKKGELPDGLYKNYLYLEWINDPQEKKEMLSGFVDKFPSYAPAWKDYADLLEGKERLDAIQKGLAANPDVETKGVLLINKAIITNMNGDYEEAKKILTQIVFDTNSTLGNVEIAKFVLYNISQE